MLIFERNVALTIALLRNKGNGILWYKNLVFHQGLCLPYKYSVALSEEILPTSFKVSKRQCKYYHSLLAK